MVNYIRDEIDTLNNVIAHLANHRLALGFVSPFQAEEAITQLGKLAASKQYFLAISMPQHLYQLECSFLFNNETDGTILGNYYNFFYLHSHAH